LDSQKKHKTTFSDWYLIHGPRLPLVVFIPIILVILIVFFVGYLLNLIGMPNVLSFPVMYLLFGPALLYFSIGFLFVHLILSCLSFLYGSSLPRISTSSHIKMDLLKGEKILFSTKKVAAGNCFVLGSGIYKNSITNRRLLIDYLPTMQLSEVYCPPWFIAYPLEDILAVNAPVVIRFPESHFNLWEFFKQKVTPAKKVIRLDFSSVPDKPVYLPEDSADEFYSTLVRAVESAKKKK